MLMKALLQRVSRAAVHVDGKCLGEIEKGLLVFLGVEKTDNEQICEKLLDKVLAYRIFPDAQGKMNLGLKDVAGELLVVSQFTLVADTGKGLRPSFSSAGLPDESFRLYSRFIEVAQKQGVKVQAGRFGADMQVSLVNDGPVTFLLSV
jgi:D-tyrosyl-tRNA(Tyr) deacylase